jgi:hypothetical protein
VPTNIKRELGGDGGACRLRIAILKHFRSEMLACGSSAHNGRRIVTPYQQGSLDGLCGLYSIINAIRLATAGSCELGQEDWQELLYALAVATDDTVGLSMAMACGLNADPLFAIMRAGIRHMLDEHDLLISGRRLLSPGDRPPLGQLLEKLAPTVENPKSAVILSLSGSLDHWTVLRRINRASLELFDSSGHARVKIANARMLYEPATARSVEHVIYPRAIFVMSLRDS